MKGNLYLIPNTLGNPDPQYSIPEEVRRVAVRTRVFIVEDLRNARRYLRRLNKEMDIDRLTFYRLNKHTRPGEIPAFLENALRGTDTALLSEAGVPGVADPGAVIVRLAQEKGIRVIPLPGPSSILLALMGSGMNGQQFAFHGYLPVKRPARIRKIREIEQELQKTTATQIFMEAPYRNTALLEDLIRTCQPSTRLCIAADLTTEKEFLATRTVREWKHALPGFHKRPAIFLLGR